MKLDSELKLFILYYALLSLFITLTLWAGGVFNADITCIPIH